MSKADDLFFKEFGAVLIALTVFGVAMFFLAAYIGGNAFDKVQNAPSAITERIAPVGRVRLDGEAVPVVVAAAPAPAPAAPAAGEGKSGEEVYNAACAACHAAGVAGAPKTGDEAAWQTRYEQGLDTLVTHAINGKGAMPAKGGHATLSDEEVHRAVVHMLSESGMEVPDDAASATSAATGSTAGEVAEAEAAPAEAEQVAAAETDAAPADAEQVAAVDETASTPPAASAGKPGEQVYKMACAACHIAGVAGAPKTGDNEAWAKRAEAGVDALVQTVITGKGAMPAKAGVSSLTEDDIRNAVNYLLEQAGVPG